LSSNHRLVCWTFKPNETFIRVNH